MTTFTTDDRLNAESNAKEQVGKHTKGPWFTSVPNEGGGILIKPIPGQVVAQCDELPEMEANAHLISAAPELLEALIQAVAWMDGEKTPINALAHARSIIAKAKGEKE